MSEYLSKEEIKQWRSSLEKITLEEFAARLGKKIEEAKPTNDLVDIVLKGQPVISTSDDWMPSKAERLSTIADRAYEREREIAPSPFSISNIKIDADVLEHHEQAKTPVKTSAKKASAKPKTEKKVKTVSKTTKKTKKERASKTVKAITKSTSIAKSDAKLREEVRVVFKKALTDREQKVFDYFLENNNKIVYAKDLATLLDLPRDYVYKYIKNLRAKIEGDKLNNADKGGFILHM